MQDFFTRMCTARSRDNTIKFTLNRTAQAIERMSLKIDDQNLTDGTHRSEHDRQLYQPPPPHRPPSQLPPPRYFLQHLQFSEFFYKEDMQSFIYQYNDFKDEDKEMLYGRRWWLANPNPKRRGGFLKPNKAGFLSLSVIRKENTQTLMSLGSFF